VQDLKISNWSNLVKNMWDFSKISKFKLSVTVAETAKFISLILHGWLMKMITAEFGMSEHTVREGEALQNLWHSSWRWEWERPAFVCYCYTDSHPVLWEWWVESPVSWQGHCVCKTATWNLALRTCEKEIGIVYVILMNCTWHFVGNTRWFKLDFQNVQNCVQNSACLHCARITPYSSFWCKKPYWRKLICSTESET
jgi:hypothetical protein